MPLPLLLEEQLLAKGLISEDQLRIARFEHSKYPNISLTQTLVNLGFISEGMLRDVMGERLGQTSVDLSHVIVNPLALRLVPREFAVHHRLFPLHYDAVQHTLTVAMADATDIIALDRLRALTQGASDPQIKRIDTLLAGATDIARAIDQYYGQNSSIPGILHEIEAGRETTQPIVRLVDALLADAVGHQASDIHFEPEQHFLRIRYRIDGVLRQVRALHKSYWAAMVVRIKVMCGMNIAETRAPQDGHVSLNIKGYPMDFRVSSHPTLHGENVVLRILDRQKNVLPLENLGLNTEQFSCLKRMIARPEGIILVTGPTGSGKTTTLYSILNHLCSEQINIVTLEDPVEYPMPMIRQTSLSEATKLDFVNGIRSMMRQDPDVILVGEIRDAETAQMAFRAAMTGHQVYSTLHSHSAIGAFSRLNDIGINPEVMEGNIIGIIAQRLIRKLCDNCKQLYTPPCTPTSFYRPVGCERCDHQGYKGRMAIMEILRMDADLDELIARRASKQDIRILATQKGCKTLAEQGMAYVKEGATSLEELARMVDLTDMIRP